MAEKTEDMRGDWFGAFEKLLENAKYAADKALFDECKQAQTL